MGKEPFKANRIEKRHSGICGISGVLNKWKPSLICGIRYSSQIPVACSSCNSPLTEPLITLAGKMAASQCGNSHFYSQVKRTSATTIDIRQGVTAGFSILRSASNLHSNTAFHEMWLASVVPVTSLIDPEVLTGPMPTLSRILSRPRLTKAHGI
ncbi:hypothetical protein BaRGS_00016565 [Batillaria attramentaria]|uniref:Uncharacterized protein n=1 Tax=Batillaria attramentaria TaxID=370345 RepID=A0ABD0KYL8_9CAEN